jgi:hypothetical protein
VRHQTLPVALLWIGTGASFAHSHHARITTAGGFLFAPAESGLSIGAVLVVDIRLEVIATWIAFAVVPAAAAR